jgi:hypothetical protein
MAASEISAKIGQFRAGVALPPDIVTKRVA